MLARSGRRRQCEPQHGASNRTFARAVYQSGRPGQAECQPVAPRLPERGATIPKQSPFFNRSEADHTQLHQQSAWSTAGQILATLEAPLEPKLFAAQTFKTKVQLLSPSIRADTGSTGRSFRSLTTCTI